MQLTAAETRSSGHWMRASEMIRDLPGVMRVQTNAAADQILIEFDGPAEGLLRHIHQTLQAGATN